MNMTDAHAISAHMQIKSSFYSYPSYITSHDSHIPDDSCTSHHIPALIYH